MSDPLHQDQQNVQRAEESTPPIAAAALFPLLNEAVEGALRLRKYVRTRRRVLSGDAVWELSEDSIKSEQLMGPWEFELYQCLISAAPSASFRFLASFLPFTVFHDSKGEEAIHFWCEFSCSNNEENSIERVADLLEPLMVPLILGILCFATAFATLAPGWSRDQFRRQQRAHLYLDGALGLWPQAGLFFGALTVPFVVYGAPGPGGPLSSVFMIFGFAGAAIFLVCFGRQFWLTNVYTPRRLFQISQYDGSLVRMYFFMIVVAFVTSVLLGIVLIAAEGSGVVFGKLEDVLLTVLGLPT